jgi:hypothetical protein
MRWGPPQLPDAIVMPELERANCSIVSDAVFNGVAVCCCLRAPFDEDQARKKFEALMTGAALPQEAPIRFFPAT